MSRGTLSLPEGAERCVVPPLKTKPKVVTPLRLEAIVVKDDVIVHTLKFDYHNLNERWPFLVRMEEALASGYGIALKKIDPKAERLLKRFPKR